MKTFINMFFIALLGMTILTGCSKTLEGVKDDSSKNWDATKDGTNKAWESTKEAVHKATE
ncbi:MAG: hypothetical protein WC141_10300 [Arcobacteraceae bacterium]